VLRTTVRLLVIGLALSIIALGAPSQASANPVAPQSTVMVAAETDNPPVDDCLSMATFVLGGLAVRAGAAAYAVGQGAIYANAGSVIGNILDVGSSYDCVSYLAPRYIDLICEQSRQGLRYKKTWEARALISFATMGRANRC